MNRDDVWARAGDAGRLAVLGSALLLPVKDRDLDEAFDALVAILACSAISKAIKALWTEPRPNGEDNNSFPSQHAAEAFAAALSLRRSRASLVSALAAASAVAATRLLARKHRAADVVAGASIGIVAASLACRRSTIDFR